MLKWDASGGWAERLAERANDKGSKNEPPLITRSPPAEGPEGRPFGPWRSNPKRTSRRPLPDVTVHVVQPKCIDPGCPRAAWSHGLKFGYHPWGRWYHISSLEQSAFIVAAREASNGPCAARVFPLGSVGSR